MDVIELKLESDVSKIELLTYKNVKNLEKVKEDVEALEEILHEKKQRSPMRLYNDDFRFFKKMIYTEQANLPYKDRAGCRSQRELKKKGGAGRKKSPKRKVGGVVSSISNSNIHVNMEIKGKNGKGDRLARTLPARSAAGASRDGFEDGFDAEIKVQKLKKEMNSGKEYVLIPSDFYNQLVSL